MRVIIAHPEKQHSFRLASALKKHNLLFKYITTVYDSQYSWLMKLSKLLISSNNMARANSRKNVDLNQNEILQIYELRGLIELFLIRVECIHKVYKSFRKITVSKFGRRVAEIAISNNVDAVIMYDTTALECFQVLKTRAPKIKRILDTSAANREYMLEIYKRDINISPDFAELLIKEIDCLSNERQMDYIKKEIQLSQYFLAGSTFVKHSLMHSGVKEDSIHTIHYGVDTKMFNDSNKRVKNAGQVLDFVFIGGTKQLKGLSYLLKAFIRIQPEHANLTVFGNNNLPRHILRKFGERIVFAGKILNSDLAKILNLMDVCICPSLGEGMNLSVLEAMASGLPVITTINSGTNDLIDDGINGFVIPIQDEHAIFDKVNWCIDHRKDLLEIGKKARETALRYTWEKYYENVSNSVLTICHR